MKIAIEVHMLGAQETGIATYVRSLVDELHARLDRDSSLRLELLCKPQQCESLNQLFPPHPHLRISAIPGQRYWTNLHLPRWLWLHRRALRQRLDVLLFPAQNVPIYLPVPALTTVHDTAFLNFPDCFKTLDRWRLRLLTSAAVRRASGIVADSQVTANDVVRHYGVDPSQVTVAPLAADTRRFQPAAAETLQVVLREHALDPGYVLAVGTLQPRKNYKRLIEAVAALRQRGLPLQLVIAGMQGWLYEEVLETISQLDADDYVHLLGFVPDDHLPALYSGAQISVQVGLYEGFGIPVLESFACQTPMVVSNTGAVAEVAGSAALSVDPTSVAAIADAIETLVTDPKLQTRYRVAMTQRLAQFSWAKTADATLGAAQKLLPGGE